MKKIAFTGIMMILAGICWIYKVEIRNFVYDVKNYILYNNVSPRVGIQNLIRALK